MNLIMWRRILLLCLLICFADCGIIRKRQANTFRNTNRQFLNRSQNSNFRGSDFVESDDTNYNIYNDKRNYSQYNDSKRQNEYEQNRNSNYFTNNLVRQLNSETTETTRQISYAQVQSYVYNTYQSEYQTYQYTNNNKNPVISQIPQIQNDPIISQTYYQNSGYNQDINRNDGYTSENSEKLNTNNKEFGLVEDKRVNINLSSTPTKLNIDNDRKMQIMSHVQDENPIIAPNYSGKIEIEFPPTISYDENLSTTTRASILDFIKNSRTTERNYNKNSQS